MHGFVRSEVPRGRHCGAQMEGRPPAAHSESLPRGELFVEKMPRYSEGNTGGK